MEYWDIYNKERQLTGRRMKRGDEFGDNEFHLVVHICIFNSEGNMLINKDNHSKMDGLISGI